MKSDKKKVLRIGVDFDGVVAYNPFRIFRAFVTGFKRKVLKKIGLKFFIPKTGWQRTIWGVLHESSVFPARGVDLLKEAVENGSIEVHLVTGRYSYLNRSLDQWLDRYRLRSYFKSINLNEKNDQPHLFKKRVIERYKFDYFIEDNWDIVHYLDENCSTPVCWIYNLVDRLFVPQRKGFSVLEDALRWILKQEK